MVERKKAIGNFIILIGTLLINSLGASGQINNYSQKEVSDKFPTLITPNPGTFSIWGIIYMFLIVSIILMIIKSNDLQYKKIINAITLKFWIASLFNILWIISFSYLQLELSVLLIFGLLISLLSILKSIETFNTKKTLLLPITFGLYAGWIFVATIVNISATLVKLKWNRFYLSENFWASLTLIVAVILIYLITLKIKNAVFPLPIAWAFYGINNQLQSSNVLTNQYMILKYIALGGAVALIIIAIYQFYKNNYNLIPSVK